MEGSAGGAGSSIMEGLTELQHKFLNLARDFDWAAVKQALEADPSLVNAQPGKRWSALHQAAHSNNRNAVQMLLEFRADPLAIDMRGKTPRQVTESDEIGQLLLQAELKLQPEPEPEADDAPMVQALQEHALVVRKLDSQLVQAYAQREDCKNAGCSELELQEVTAKIAALERRICELQEADKQNTGAAAKQRESLRHAEKIQRQTADAALAAWLHVCPGEGEDRHPTCETPEGIAVGSIESHRRYGGLGVEQLMQDVDLVDAGYLIALATVGGVLPRWQELPGCAKIKPENAWRLRWKKKSLPVLVISYPWLSKEHPDPQGLQLQRISPILEAMVTEARECAGQHCTVGVMLDYCSLPQLPRTEAEQEKFVKGLNTMHKWYAHPFTHVLLMAGPLPPGSHSNSVPYMSRGWCYIEHQMAALVKNSDLLWDYAGYTGALSYYKCIRQLQAHRKRHPPLSPDQVKAELHELTASGVMKFSYIEDLETVVDMYRRGFVDAFNGYRKLRCVAPGHSTTTIWYGELGWGPREAEDLAMALNYAQAHCPMEDGYIEIELPGNRFGESGIDAFARVPCVRLSGLKSPRVPPASGRTKFVLVLDANDKIDAVESGLWRVSTAEEKAMSGLFDSAPAPGAKASE